LFIKTPFLHAKNHTFVVQKPYFYTLKTTLLFRENVTYR